MQQINRETTSVMDESVEYCNEILSNGKKKVKSLLPKAGLITSIFLMFLMLVVMTTNVKLTNFADFAGLGLSFFILFFATYLTYVSASDSGLRAGAESPNYKEAIKKHTEYKDKANKDGYTQRLGDFCQHYADNELKNTRRAVMISVGIDYELYKKTFLGQDEKIIKRMKQYPKVVRKAAIIANNIGRIKMTPDMILRRERTVTQRNPLGIDPRTKLKKAYTQKFFTSAAISLMMSSIVFDMLAEFTWASLAGVVLKLMLTMASIWTGYSMGYNNKAIDAAGYLNDQCDLFLQLFDFVDKEKQNEIDASNSRCGHDAAECVPTGAESRMDTQN